MRILTIVFMLAACFVSLSFAEESKKMHDAGSDELRLFLSNGYTSAKSIIDNVKIVSEQLSETDPEFMDSEPDYIAQEYIFKYGKERYVKLYQGTEASDENIGSRADLIGTQDSPMYRVFDGRYTLKYDPRKGMADHRSKIGRGKLEFSMGSLMTSSLGPVKFFGYDVGLMPDDLLSDPETSIESQPEKIGDLSAYKVSSTVTINNVKYNIAYWLAPDRSCQPIKMELRETDGTLKKRMEAKDFVQLEDGTWIAKRVVQGNFSLKNGKPYEHSSVTHSIKNIELNPEIDEDKVFSTLLGSLPDGTHVQDIVSGLQYTVGEGPVNNLKIKRIIEEMVEDVSLGLEVAVDQNEVLPVDKEEKSVVEAKPLFAEAGITKTPPAIQEKSSVFNWKVITLFVVVILVVVGFIKKNKLLKSKKNLVLVIIATFLIAGSYAKAEIELESWQNCCGAICMQVVSQLLGSEAEFAEIRELVKANSQGETTMANLLETANKIGFYAEGFRVKSEKIQEFTVPVIAYKHPNHFVVFLGLGKGKGVVMIDPPRKAKKMDDSELMLQEYWDVLAVSKHPFSAKGIDRSKAEQDYVLDNVKSVPKTFGDLHFDDISWYFGHIKKGTKENNKFYFKNVGKEKVTISDIKVSCRCLEIGDFTSEVLPGQEGVIEVTFNSKGMLGYIGKQITGTISSDGQKGDVFLLEVTGQVSKKGELILIPDRISLPNLIKGSVSSKTVKIKRAGYDHMYLGEIKPDSPSVLARVIGDSVSDDYEAKIQIQVKAEDLGPFKHEVVFETDFPDKPTIKLDIYGSVISHIKAEPSKLFLGFVDGQKSLEETVTLKSITNKAFEIKDVKTKVANLITEARAVNEDRTVWEIKLSNVEPLREGVINSKLLVETDDSDSPMVSIPFTGLVVEEKTELASN